MKDKELHQQVESCQAQMAAVSPQQEKVQLIDSNTKYFKKLLFFSIKVGCVRLIAFFIVIIFEQQFIVIQGSKNYSESWNIMFYVLASMMDFLGILNDAQIFKHLQKDQEILRQIKTKIMSRAEIRTQTQIGSYTYYLSIYDIVKKYKYRSKSSISISQTIRFLHVIITICIFGNLAINAQNNVEGQYFKILFLWAFILSIYLSVFEIDFFVLQNSEGSFIQKKVKAEVNKRQESGQNLQSSIIKSRYIKNCRRPFQICYIINILSMLAVLIAFFKLSLLNLMLTLCICAHMLELVHQKHLQNKLIDLDLQKISFVYIKPYKILAQLTKTNRNLYPFVVVITRIMIVFCLFAYFKEQEVTTLQNVCMITLIMLLVISQSVKFKRMDSTKLYILQSQNPQNQESVQCSICLMQLQANQKRYQLPCFSKHLFHQKCMKNWFSQRKECPLCRYQLQIYNLQ